MVIIIERFGERVKHVWHNIYDLNKKNKQTKLSNLRKQQEGKQ